MLAGCAILIALALIATPAPAAERRAPVIVSTQWDLGGDITVGATIDPEGLETNYEVALRCRTCGPPGYTPATGQLPAIDERLAVSLNLTGIKPGSYGFYVYASNADGATIRESILTVPPPPPGAHPEGLGPGTPYEPPPISKASIESAERQAAIITAEAEARRRQQTHEQEEHHANEAATRYAKEAAMLKQAEERQAQEAAAREEAEHPACRVPALKGDAFTAARRALRRAHCRLGAVHQPVHHHSTLYVSAQGAPAGERLAHGARVALWVGAKENGAKRASRR